MPMMRFMTYVMHMLTIYWKWIWSIIYDDDCDPCYVMRHVICDMYDGICVVCTMWLWLCDCKLMVMGLKVMLKDLVYDGAYGATSLDGRFVLNDKD